MPEQGPIRREGGLLRVHGSSLKNVAEARADARRAFELWLWRLETGDDVGERKRLIDGVLDAPESRPIPSPVVEIGYNVLIEVRLDWLQRRLGTHYE